VRTTTVLPKVRQYLSRENNELGISGSGYGYDYNCRSPRCKIHARSG